MSVIMNHLSKDEINKTINILGYDYFIPILLNHSKKPNILEWTIIEAEKLHSIYRKAEYMFNIGTRLDRLAVIDIDVKHGLSAGNVEEIAGRIINEAADFFKLDYKNLLIQKTASGGYHLIFRLKEDTVRYNFQKDIVTQYQYATDSEGTRTISDRNQYELKDYFSVDLLTGNKNQLVIAPSMINSVKYEFINIPESIYEVSSEEWNSFVDYMLGKYKKRTDLIKRERQQASPSLVSPVQIHTVVNKNEILKFQAIAKRAEDTALYSLLKDNKIYIGSTMSDSGNIQCCCPFHSDKTPSAIINNNETLHCFTCGKTYLLKDACELFNVDFAQYKDRFIIENELPAFPVVESCNVSNSIEENPLYSAIETIENFDKELIAVADHTLELEADKIHPVLVSFIRRVMPFTDAPQQFILLSALATLGSQLNEVYYIHGSKRIYCNIWIILNGLSTVSRKSTSLSIAQKLIIDKHKELTELYQEELQIYKRAVNNKDDSAVEPVRKLLIIPQDITMEKLYQLMEHNQNVIVYASELMSLLSKFEKSYNSDAKATLTDWFDVPALVEKDTKTGGFIKFERPKISIVAGTTPEWLRKSTDADDIMSGFLARFVFCNVTEKRGDKLIAIPEKMTEDTLNNFKDLTHRLRGLSAEFTLSREAKILYEQFYRAEILKLENSPHSEKLSSFANRLITDYCFKFCVLFTALDRCTTGVITTEISKLNMERSLYLVKYLLRQMEQVILSNFIYRTNNLESKIYDKIRKSQAGYESKTVLMRHLRAGSKEFDVAIQNLVDKELINVSKIFSSKNGKGKFLYLLA